MRSVIALAVASALGASAQTATPPAAPGSPLSLASLGFDPKTCSKEKTPDNLDPMVQFPPKNVNWPCDFGAAVPYGKVPTGCAKFEVIVARGTSEGGQFGTVVGDPLVARVIRDLPKGSARGYPVQYPADMSAMPKEGADPKIANERRLIGPKDTLNRIISQMKECPDERFALVGYSQGGGVISAAAAQLTPEQIKKVDAIVTYGSKGAIPKELQNKWLNNCAPGDMCGGDPGTEGHLSYNNVGTIWHDRSAKYIADAFNGKSQGQVFAKTSKN